MNPESTTAEPTAADILGPDGPIARAKPGYEARPQQLAMTAAVAEAIASKHHLVVEAGTGVGKSLAYAVPAILAALDAGEKVVISTHTKALQEQLIGDLKFLRGVMPRPFKFALAKGRANYLSLRRLGVALDRPADFFPSPVGAEARDQLKRIRDWAKQTKDGSTADLDFRPRPVVWEEVASDDDHCRGRECPTHAACFYYKSRAKMKSAQVLVVNHALYLTHVNVMRKKGEVEGFLPEHHVVVFDEAHTLEGVTSEHFGEKVTSALALKILDKISDESTEKGLIDRVWVDVGHAWLKTATAQVTRTRESVLAFFEATGKFLDGKTVSRSRTPPPPDKLPDALVDELKKLSGVLTEGSTILLGKGKEAEVSGDNKAVEDLADARMRIEFAAKRVWALCLAINTWLKQPESGDVYWLEGDPERDVITLAYAPLNVGPILRERVWDKIPSCVLTSATLAVGSPPSFDHVRARLGLEGDDVATLAVGSPFDYVNQVRLFLPLNLPDPADPRRDGAYERQAIRAIPHYLWKTRGNAFCLFTSKSMMMEAARVLRPWIDARGWPLLVQDELPPAKLLEKFRAGGCVLFGVESFWAGVDVPGAALANVIIVRLPFPPPDQPLLEARMEDFRSRGGHPFFGYLVPEAVIKFKQGFGRLIRSKADRGIAVVLDPRLTIKGYGCEFLESLPTCRMVRETLRDSDLRPALATTSSGAPGDAQATPDGSGW